MKGDSYTSGEHVFFFKLRSAQHEATKKPMKFETSGRVSSFFLFFFKFFFQVLTTVVLSYHLPPNPRTRNYKK